MDILTHDKSIIKCDDINIIITGYDNNTKLYISNKSYICGAQKNKWCLGLCYDYDFIIEYIGGVKTIVCQDCKQIYESSTHITKEDFINYIKPNTKINAFVGFVRKSFLYACYSKDNCEFIDASNKTSYRIVEGCGSGSPSQPEYIRRKYIRRLLMFAQTDLIKDIIKEIARLLISL